MNAFSKPLYQISQGLSRQHKQMAIWLLDVTLVPLSFLLAVMFTYSDPWPADQFSRLAIVFPILALAGGFASLAFGHMRVKLKTYQTSGALGLFPFAGAMGLTLLFLSYIPGLYFPTVGTLAFTLILYLASIGARLGMLRLYLIALGYGKTTVRVLIYGAGTTGLGLASALRGHETITPVAFIDDDPNLHDRSLAGLRIYPSDQIESIIAKYNVRRIILAMPSLSAPNEMRIGRKLLALGLELQVLPSFEHLEGAKVRVDALRSVSAGDFLNRAGLDQELPDGAESYRDRVIMVSGAGGSVGSELCRQLISCCPKKLVLYELSEYALYLIERELRGLCATADVTLVAVLGSVTDARSVRQAISAHGVQIVFHAAAYKHVPMVEANPLSGLINNVFGTRTLAATCVECGVERVLLVSTDKAVRPTNVMGASKRLAELVLQDMARRHSATQFSIVRFGNVLGSSGSVIPLFKEQIACGGPITLTHSEVTRYFMTLTEAARLVLLAGSFQDDSSRAHAHVYVLDMGKPVRIRDLAEQLIEAAGYTLRDEKNPGGDIEIKIVGLRPGEKLHEELLIGDGLLTTPHPKILRATEEDSGAIEISDVLQQIGGFAATGDAEAARDLALEVALGAPASVKAAITAR